jgi:hypothetical protein
MSIRPLNLIDQLSIHDYEITLSELGPKLYFSRNGEISVRLMRFIVDLILRL